MNLFKPRQVKLINALIKYIKAKQNLENSSYFQVDGCIIVMVARILQNPTQAMD